MTRVLIVDDEPYIRSLLAERVRWSEASAHVVATARDGAEALSILRRERIDLLLTDLRMPKVDGLTLIGEVRRRYPKVVVAVLSAHDDFCLVRRALQLQVVDYLLKDELDLAGVPKVVRGWMERSTATVHDEREFMRVMARKAVEGRLAPEVACEALGIPAPPDGGRLYLAVGIPHRITPDGVPLDNRQSVLSLVAARCEGVIAYSDRSTFVFVFPSCTPQQPSEVESRVCALHQELNAALVHDGVTVSIGYSDTFLTMRRLSQQKEAALRAAKRYFVRGKGRLYRVRPTSHPSSEVPPLTLPHIPDVVTLLGGGTAETVDDTALARFLITGIAVVPDHTPSYLTYFARVYALLSAELDRGRPDPEGVVRAHLSRWEGLGEGRRRLDDYNRWLRETLSATLAVRYYGHRTIDAIVDFVRANLADDLSLSRVSEHFSYNPAYVSRLFREVTGERYATYVQHCRMEHARCLLRHPGVRVGEVALAVGFQNGESFTRAFKRLTGLSPRQAGRLEGRSRKKM